MLLSLHQQEIQFLTLEDRLQWVMELLWVVELLWVMELWAVELLWVVELCGKGMQLVGLDEQEVQILSLVNMLQMRVHVHSCHNIDLHN